MRNHILHYSVLATALACAFAVVPLNQALAQDANMQTQESTDNQTVPDKAADTWITTKVKAELATAKNVKASDISVETSDSVVTLSGMVPTKSEKMRAVTQAKAVKGVKSVDASNLRVNATQPDSTMHKTDRMMNDHKMSAMPAHTASAPAMAMAHDADDAHMQKSADNQTVPDKAADTWITTKVKAELATAKDVKASDISVETNDGMVTLSGMVPTKSEKTRAVKQAKAVKGVKSVDASNLRVSGNMHKSDHAMSDTPAHTSTAGH